MCEKLHFTHQVGMQWHAMIDEIEIKTVLKGILERVPL